MKEPVCDWAPLSAARQQLAMLFSSALERELCNPTHAILFHIVSIPPTHLKHPPPPPWILLRVTSAFCAALWKTAWRFSYLPLCSGALSLAQTSSACEWAMNLCVCICNFYFGMLMTKSVCIPPAPTTTTFGCACACTLVSPVCLGCSFLAVPQEGSVGLWVTSPLPDSLTGPTWEMSSSHICLFFSWSPPQPSLHLASPFLGIQHS